MGMSTIPIVNVNNNCSTGSTALYMCNQLVAGGIADCVLALGFEKMAAGSLQATWYARARLDTCVLSCLAAAHHGHLARATLPGATGPTRATGPSRS